MSKVIKDISATLSVSVEVIRVPTGLYENMLLSDNPNLSKLNGELYLNKYLIIEDESLDCVDFDVCKWSGC